MTIELNQYNYLPPGLLDCSAKNLHQFIPGPSLIHLPGKKEQALFISILQHGNETVGLDAVQLLLKSYANEGLPRSVSLFIGNVAAARQGLRRLNHQPDYNRMWPSKNPQPALPEAKLMQQVCDIMRDKTTFASIDLHNNTGLNPHYGCINRLDNQFYQLASLFSPTVVYFIRPEGVQSMAFAELCPAVTLECGQVNDQSGVERAFKFLDACMQLAEIPKTALARSAMDLYHTVATVKVPKELSFSFSDSTQDIYFNPELEIYNFREIDRDVRFALTHPDKKVSLQVIDETGASVADKYFDFSNNEIKTRMSFMPSMITSNERVIRQDCLCYLMERFPW